MQLTKVADFFATVTKTETKLQ